MPAERSHLSDYMCDLVVSTTQATINSGLKEYLSLGNQPEIFLCFVSQLPSADNTWPDHVLVPWDDVKATGVDPFEIPDGAHLDDDRVSKLDKMRFAVGIKARMGIPEESNPSDPKGPNGASVPPVVELGYDKSKVTFNVYLSDATVVDWSDGLWTVWTQPRDEQWWIATRASLAVEQDPLLLNIPLYHNHPEIRDKLLNHLEDLEGLTQMRFSLQQLLVDLQNSMVIAYNINSIYGLPTRVPSGSVVGAVMKAYVQNFGRPLLAVLAVPNTEPDRSQLAVTSIRPYVSPAKDENGRHVSPPTPEQHDLQTLDYICAVGGNSAGTIAQNDFDWRWVDDVNSQSGAIAIRRWVIANFFLQQILPSCERCCYIPYTSVDAHAGGKVVYDCHLSQGGKPQYNIPIAGNSIAQVNYRTEARARNSSGATDGEFNITVTYNCEVTA